MRFFPHVVMSLAVLVLAEGCAQSRLVDLSADASVGTIACGAGTVLVGDTCQVADASVGTIACGAGTVLVGDTCQVADAGTPTSCGPGTVASGSLCVGVDGGSAAVACGPGTSLMGDTCIALGIAYYDIRVPVNTIPGDGHTKIPLTVLGRNADGTPATDDVVLLVSRPGSGTFSPLSLTLSETPATSWFTPCSTASSFDCVGPFRIVVALASDHAVVLAQSQELAIVVPSGVGSTAPCLGAPNALYFDGQPGSYIYSGTQLITQGQFSLSTDASGTSAPALVHVSISPGSQAQGLWWDTYFSTVQLQQPLMTTVYTDAERWPFQSAGKPGLDVSGDGRGCNQVFGSFEVHKLDVDAQGVAEFLATFEHHCESATSPPLRGCVHFTR